MNEVARQVVEAADFKSPIPALRSALQTTRTLIESITSKPLASSAIAQSAADAVAEGIING